LMTAREIHAPSSKEPLQRMITRSPQLPPKRAKKYERSPHAPKWWKPPVA